jgi:hypothetical protein
MDRSKSRKKSSDSIERKIKHSAGIKLSPSICSDICIKAKYIYPNQYYVVPIKEKYVLLVFLEKNENELIFTDGKNKINVKKCKLLELDLSNTDRYTQDRRKSPTIGSIVKINGVIYLALSIASTEIDNIFTYSLLRQDGALVKINVDNREIAVMRNKNNLKLKSNKIIEKNLNKNKCRRGTPKPIGSLKSSSVKNTKLTIIKTNSDGDIPTTTHSIKTDSETVSSKSKGKKKRVSRKTRHLRSIIKPRYSHERSPNKKNIRINENKNEIFEI